MVLGSAALTTLVEAVEASKVGPQQENEGVQGGFDKISENTVDKAVQGNA